MADELQALLDRINEEGIKEAEERKRQLLDKAEKEAERLVSSAREEAEAIIGEAREEAELLREKGEESLRQAARDVLLSLRDRLEQRMAAVARACVGEAVSADVMGEIIVAMVTSYEERGGRVDSLSVLLGKDQLEGVESTLLSRLGEDLREHCELAPMPDIAAGFRLSFNDEDVLYDFSDDSLAETMAAFLNAKLTAILRGEKEAEGADGDDE